MNFEAALYDLDGLIVDSEPLHGVASEKALNVYGRSLEELSDEVRGSFYGKRVIDIASLVVDSLGLDIPPQRWADERHAIFMELIENGVDLMPGMRQSLSLFRESGIKAAVVSSGVGRYVRRLLEITGLDGDFDTVVTGDEVRKGKPDPECFLEGARRLGARPGRCIVLEDAWAGIRAGRAAGMAVIAVRNEFNANYNGAHVVLDSLDGLDSTLLETLSTRKN
ncbi:MAG: HAD family phosphatase [Candidatus Glassbacteria bacterium]|nr:HAD family phosphatase [Candidatus Glassbacteria bacterium]